MSLFSNMEQAERMQAKYAYLAEYYIYEKEDIDKSEHYYSLAERLESAIANIYCNQADQEDWDVFNAAVASRTELDVYNAIRSDLRKGE